MPRIDVDASIDIAAPIERVRAVLVDFNTWPSWSPWLYIEPEAIVDYRGEPGQPGHGYDWRGEKVGQGGMTLLETSDDRIRCDLQFLKPFKSEAKVDFDAAPNAAPTSTHVTWSMQSSLPIFLFWMTGTMTGMIRSDYRRGLTMLKDYIETGSVPSRSELQPIGAVDAADHLALHASAALPALSDSMGDAFAQVSAQAADSINGAPFTVYRKMDMRRDRCDYTVGLPVAGGATPHAPVQRGQRPACDALSLVHTGAYRHLGSAWAMLMAEARHRKLKPVRGQPPFEIYLDDPAVTPESDLRTQLYYPTRAA